jgi:16S rRNA (adenine1518-N6/adenine1519-N6)-dimethyltransferase
MSSSHGVKAKKHLGQHFLKELKYAERIAQAISFEDKCESKLIAEIGPGTGALTQFILKRSLADLIVFEVDTDSVEYLLKAEMLKQDQIYGDFLQSDLNQIFNKNCNILVGNFPYNISSQIFFKVLEIPDQIDQVVCMLQKEVADRIVADEGGKIRGILSVLIQAFYDVKYLFTVPPGAFNPPPKVQSAVIELKRNDRKALPVAYTDFARVVKMGFNQRRKTLRNAVKALNPESKDHELLTRRAETLSVEEFITLTQFLYPKN